MTARKLCAVPSAVGASAIAWALTPGHARWAPPWRPAPFSPETVLAAIIAAKAKARRLSWFCVTCLEFGWSSPCLWTVFVTDAKPTSPSDYFLGRVFFTGIVLLLRYDLGTWCLIRRKWPWGVFSYRKKSRLIKATSAAFWNSRDVFKRKAGHWHSSWKWWSHQNSAEPAAFCFPGWKHIGGDPIRFRAVYERRLG